eukprot:1654489-Amphidinium_carterae.3
MGPTDTESLAINAASSSGMKPLWQGSDDARWDLSPDGYGPDGYEGEEDHYDYLDEDYDQGPWSKVKTQRQKMCAGSLQSSFSSP